MDSVLSGPPPPRFGDAKIRNRMQCAKKVQQIEPRDGRLRLQLQSLFKIQQLEHQQYAPLWR